MYKNIGIFLLGAAIGSLITYKLIVVEYEEVIEAEPAKHKVDQVAEELAFYQKQKKNTVITVSKPVIEKLTEDQKIDYAKKIKKYVDAAGEVEEDVEFVSEPEKKEHDDVPYVIDIEEFSDGEETFDKITVYYYEFDNILVEAEDEEPEDIDGTIGWGSLDCFGEGSVNPDIVYVRNEKLSIDYEVIRLRESYEKSVLGHEK